VWRKEESPRSGLN